MESGEVEALREKDPHVAEVIARYVNKLVDRGVLTTQQVVTAAPECFDELILRYPYLLQDDALPDQYMSKVASLFYPQQEKNTRMELSMRRALERKQVIVQMRALLSAYQEKQRRDPSLPPVEGLIIFGSRMHPYKTPRENERDTSDLDILPIIPSTYIHRSPISSEMEQIFASLFPNPKYPLGISSAEYGKDLIDKMRKKDFTSPPIWAWHPDSVYFIGSISDDESLLTEDQVQRDIRAYTDSSEYGAWKQELLDEIKALVVREDGAEEQGSDLNI